jgi:hypothetical protein
MGMLLVQSLIGVGGRPFSVGQATLPPSESWLLEDYRARSGEPHMKLGIFPGENAGLPSGRFYSFRDIARDGHVTFIEVDDATVARVGSNDVVQHPDCHRLKGFGDRRLVQCISDKQALVYDLDRVFVAAVSPADGELLEHVLDVVAR